VHLFLYRRLWRGSLSTSLLFPVLYLAALGVGLGSLVNHHTGSVDGVSYLDFLAPGLLAATVFQVIIGESSYPVMARVRWDKTYFAMLASPLSVSDLVIGHLLWLAVRAGIVAATFLAVMAAFGTVASPFALGCLPLAMLCGVAYGAPMSAYAITTESEQGFPMIYRFVVIPLFLFSGTFYPISQLPRALQFVAQVTPLSHAVSLSRMCTLGIFHPVQALIDLGYLTVLLVVGVVAAHRAFTKRLWR